VANIYLSRPDEMRVATRVESCALGADGRAEIVLAENPFRPAGGGQPADHGWVEASGRVLAVESLRKSGGEVRITLAAGPIAAGEEVQAQVDAVRRRRLSQCHSLTHLLMAGLKEVVPGFESKGAEIDDEGCGIELLFKGGSPVSPDLLANVDRIARGRIAQAVPIRVERVKSPEAAAATYPEWRVDPGLGLSGKIRVIVIEGIDANPCSGTHVRSTSEIGPFAILGFEPRGSDAYSLHAEKRDDWSYWF
jgi:Ser-tRNA(Ala) deacylase AlaX